LILLSLATKRGSSSDTAGAQVIEDIRGKRLKVLVVDDEREFRRSLCFRLRKKYAAYVDEAKSGSEGIRKVGVSNAYDLILVDLKMPKKTGVETYRELTKIIGNDCRVVLMSAYSDSEEWQKAMALGVELLHKPISDQRLTEMLQATRPNS
jgi:two-component system response regulator YesN